MDDPYGTSGSGLPPSKFGAGYTVGDQDAEAAPAYGYPSQYPPPAPEPPAAPTRYPTPPPPTAGGAPPQYPPPPQYPVMAVPVGYVPAARTNSMAIAALVSSLVVAPLGIVFGHIALSQINRTGEDGRGLAIAGLVIGYILTGIFVIWIAVMIVLGALFTSAVNDSTYYDDGYTYSMAATILDEIATS